MVNIFHRACVIMQFKASHARARKLSSERRFTLIYAMRVPASGDESEILEPFETTSDTCFLAVYVSELSGICNDVIEGHEY